MKKFFTLILPPLAALLLTTSCQAAPQKQAALTLAQNGKSAYVIALAADAIPAEKTAASELQATLQQISGARLPIQDESAVTETAPQIVVGASTRARKLAGAQLKKIGKDGIVIQTVGRNLVLAGDRPRGTLYAVGEFLESLDVRHWTPTESFVPKKSTLRVLAQNTVYTPPFFYREHFTTSVMRDPLFATEMRENGNHQQQDAALGGHYTIIGFVHTFDRLMPPEKYFKAHPEWYSDPDNGNKPCTAASTMPAPQHSQLNLTDAAMRAELTKNVLAAIRENPTAGIISVSQNDNVNYCQSAGDMAMIAREGSPSAPLLDMVNQVADAVKKEFPNFLVETLAYQHTRKPPKTMTPRDNVIIRLCSIEADFARPLDSDANADFRDDMNGWKKIAPRLYVWDYVTNFTNVIWPHPNLRVLAPNLRFFARSNVIGMFEQGDAYSNGTGDFVQLRTWILAKLMWNPQLDQTKLENEFLRGYYGAAAPHLRAYLDGIQDAFIENGGKLSTFQTNNSYLSLPVVNRAWQQFAAAQDAVKNNAVLSGRVRRERLALDHVIIDRYWLLGDETENDGDGAKVKNPAIPTDIQAFTADFLKTARANKVENYSEGGSFNNLESILATRYAPPQPLVLPEELQNIAKDRVVIDAQENRFRYFLRGSISDIVDDAAASDGKAGRMVGSTNEWAMQFDIDQSRKTLTKAPWHLYLMARIETKPGAAMNGTALAAGVYDAERKKNRLDKVVPLDGALADGKYHLIDAGAVDLDTGCFIYIAPPQRDDIAFVYIDRVILVRDK